jgi:hypothetical protein
MNVLFEEDGGFKAGSVMTDGEASLQVEMPSGKRSKIKAATVLLRFEKPAASALLEQATPLAEEIEADFLWECVSDGEFSFLDFARDYYGHEPAPVEATAVLLALHAAPVYFHRKGKGRFRKAPADILAAALASLEKKRQQALAMEGWIAELKEFRLPADIAPLTDALLYAPDRNRPETKAFETACAETGLSAAQLLFKCGAIKSAYFLHFKRFLHEQFRRAPPFRRSTRRRYRSICRARRARLLDRRRQHHRDRDALSVVKLPGIGSRIGIHIAAPGLAIAHGSRSTASLAPGCRRSTCPATRSRCCPTPWSRTTRGRRRRLPGGVVVPDGQRCAGDRFARIAAGNGAYRANLRHHEVEPGSTPRRSAARCPTSRSGTNCSTCGISPTPAKAGAASRRRCRASTTTTSRSKAIWPIPTRAPWKSANASAAARSTSWSPS